MKQEYIIQRQGKDFVLYEGLLDEAHQQGLRRISTTLLQFPNQDNGNVAVVSAEVETEKGTFSGIGDAAPNNVNKMILPHLIRMAETRAKARALRDAVNVAQTAVEEMGVDLKVDDPKPDTDEAKRAGPAPRYTPEEVAATMAANPDAAKEAERIKQAGKDTEQSGRDAVRDASADPRKPASQNQLHTIAKYKRLLGQDESIDEGMTAIEARDLIVKITGEYARRNGTNSNEEPPAPAANGLQPLVEELATLKGLSPDEVQRDIEQRCRIESLYLAEVAEHDRAEKLLRGDIAKKQRDKERQAARAGR